MKRDTITTSDASLIRKGIDTPEASSVTPALPGTTPGALAPMRLGIVVAVRNEARWLDSLLDSIRSQDGFESVCCIAAVDGRSEDRSRAILEAWAGKLPALRILDNEAKIAPVGFNIGIRECLSRGSEAILLLSGHSQLRDGFLGEIQRVLKAPDTAIVGCVLDYPPPATPFERAAQAFVESRLGRRMASFSRLSRLQETEIATFPVIRREVLAHIGLFDETMVRNQDIEFTARARSAGFRVWTSPKLRCRYSPRVTLRGLLFQMYGNGLWVGRRPSAHGIRHVAPALFFGGLLLAGGLAILLGYPWGWLAGALAGAYLLILVIATLAWVGRARSGSLWLPILFLGAHGAYAVGTFRGLLSRGRPPKVPQA